VRGFHAEKTPFYDSAVYLAILGRFEGERKSFLRKLRKKKKEKKN
jgi:hypothetical protein